MPEARVQHRGDVLELAVLADDAALAVGLHVAVEQREGPVHELGREHLARVLEQLEVVRPATGVGVRDDGGDHGAADRPLGRPLAVAEHVLDRGDPLADRDGAVGAVQRGQCGRVLGRAHVGLRDVEVVGGSPSLASG